MIYFRKTQLDADSFDQGPRDHPVSSYAMEQKPITMAKKLPIWQLIAQEKYNKVPTATTYVTRINSSKIN